MLHLLDPQLMTHIFLHAFGKRYDLPIPLALFVFGGAAVVFVSFLVVLPRAVPIEGVDVYPDQPGPYRLHVTWGTLSGLFLLVLIVSGLAGSQEIPENILPTVFWIVLWIAVPLSCGVIGNWTKPVNPFAALAEVVDRPGLRQTILGGPAFTYPDWLDFWPAAFLFFLVACGELIYNQVATIPAVTAFALLVYALFTVLASLTFGCEAWLERGEMFSVLYSTWGRIGYFRFGAPGNRGFLGGLKSRFEPTVSRITFVLLLLTSVSFDGLLATPFWKHTRDTLPVAMQPGTVTYLLLTTLAFLVLLGIAWTVFGGFSLMVRAAGGLDESPLIVLAGLLPSVLPISFGYLFAHNAEYLAINGQLLLPLLGNPAGLAWWPVLPYPFNDSYEINHNLLPSSVVWYTQVGLIVIVHIVAVVLAHDYLTRAARTVRQARAAEWPWMLDMVLYTMSSLWLLAQPLVKGG
ncbi:MAG TPA: hypothetical protein VFA78_01295 [Chloroflexota bacterium]|nr:hypothetical protein [Chloroflexota bacterium]